MVEATEPAQRLHDLLSADEDARVCRDIPEEACREQPRNFFIHMASLIASKTGDRLASPKLVLAWLMTGLGVPAFMLGLLVPIREALSLLPQLLIAGSIRRVAVRKWFWVVGSVLQGLAVATMAVVALVADGAAAGWLILALLAVFSVARGVCSVSAKDVLGKTISKGRRGAVTGYASSIAGAVTVLVGLLAYAFMPTEQDLDLFVILLSVAAVLWILAGFFFSRLTEYRGATSGGGNAITEALRQLHLIREEKDLRDFLIVRTLLLSTALVAPFYVAVAGARTGGAMTQFGAMLVATGAASFVSAPLWGRMADRSSREVMAIAALLASVAGFVTAWLSQTHSLPYTAVAFAFTYFILNIAHAGVRVGRKTHLIDIATAENRASYVAVSNTVIGLMLLAGSALGGIAAIAGPTVVIVLLSVISLVAAGAASRLEEAQ